MNNIKKMKGFRKFFLLLVSLLWGVSARVFVDPHKNLSKPAMALHHNLHLNRKMIPKRQFEMHQRHGKLDHDYGNRGGGRVMVWKTG